jgi:hypothetical protein
MTTINYVNQLNISSNVSQKMIFSDTISNCSKVIPSNFSLYFSGRFDLNLSCIKSIIPSRLPLIIPSCFPSSIPSRLPSRFPSVTKRFLAF